MSEYTKEQEAEALAHVETLLRPEPHHKHLRIVLAMAKRTAEAEAIARRAVKRETMEWLKRISEGLALQLDAAKETVQFGIELRQKAEADAARLREALKRERDYACQCGDDGFRMDTCPSCRRIDAALDSTPSAEPTRTDAERWLGDGPEVPGGTLAFHAAPIAEPDYSGLCYAPECGGHCGYVHARGCEAIREYLADHGGDPYRAPTREPSERDMRVAEAVMAGCRQKIIGTAALPEHSRGIRHCLAMLGHIDLAAVVAKAVKP